VPGTGESHEIAVKKGIAARGGKNISIVYRSVCSARYGWLPYRNFNFRFFSTPVSGEEKSLSKIPMKIHPRVPPGRLSGDEIDVK